MLVPCSLTIITLLTLLGQHNVLSDTNTSSSSEIHSTALNINTQIGVESSNLEEYDEEDDLELQASEHEIEAIYNPNNGAIPSGGEETPKKNKRRRRRRRRRKRIRTSTSSYEEDATSEFPERRVRPNDNLLPDKDDVLLPTVPRRRPGGKKRRKTTTTPIPLEEEYLHTTNKKEANKVPGGHKPPENIEQIIGQQTAQGNLKYKENESPSVIFLPMPIAIEKATPKDVFTDKALIEKAIVKENLQPPNNYKEEIVPLHPKENKIQINGHLPEPILFVTAPQTGLNSVETHTNIPKQSSKDFNSLLVSSSTIPTTITESAPESTISPPTIGQETPKSILFKKLTTSSNATRDKGTNTTTNASKASLEKASEINSKNEKRPPLRRLPPTSAIFKKRIPSENSKQSAHVDATVSKENEIAELKLYTISPLDIQKLGSGKLNERYEPPTGNNFNKKTKEHKEEAKEELIIEYTTLGPLQDQIRQGDKLTKLAPSHPTKLTVVKLSAPVPSLNPIRNNNEELLISYTSSSRKPTFESTDKENHIDFTGVDTSKVGGFQDVSFTPPQVKEDILIFLKSKAESTKLSKILQSRNMTLNELIEHRERGSSQLHLAEIFNNPAAPSMSNKDRTRKTELERPSSSEEPPITFPDPTVLGAFPNFISDEMLAKEQKLRQPKFLFDSLPQFSLQGAASETIYTTRKFPDLQYTRAARPLLPNAKLVPFYGSSELILSYTSSTSNPTLFADEKILSVREQKQRLPNGLKSVITISAAILAFAVLGFFVLLVSCKVRQKKAQKYLKHAMMREHMRHEPLRSSTRSDTPVVKKGYYASCDAHSDTSSTTRQQYLWKTIRKTFRYE